MGDGYLRSRVFCLVLGLLCMGHHARGKTRPHIIFILADDLGWNDVGFHGMTDIPTPNLDAMAANSVILNNHYSCPMCTPSRGSLLSGKYPSNIGLQHFVLLNGRPWGLPLDLKILPEHLNDLGYESHTIGKWHLGSFKRQYTPLYRGFRTHYGFWNGAVDFYNQTCKLFLPKLYLSSRKIYSSDTVVMEGKDFRDQMTTVANKNHEYLTTLLTKRARSVIRRHDQSKPMFLYMAHHGVHKGNLLGPIQGPEEEKKHFAHFKEPNKIGFAAALTSLDSSVGAIFESLEKKGMLQNSVVLFVSDNGAPMNEVTANWGSNWPLRGAKNTPFEGGVKTVAMLWSPLLRKAPKVHNGLFHISDWLPTLYRLAGGDPTRLGSIDGLDQWDSLKTGIQSKRKEVLLMLDPVTNVSGIRNERYKLVNRSSGVAKTDYIFGTDDRRSETSYKVSWKDSKVYRVLLNLYGMWGLEKELAKHPYSFQVKCGDRNESSEAVGRDDGLALFDLREDPCERRNVALEKPKIVEELYQRLQFWERQSVPVNLSPLEMSSDPKYFGGFWDAWHDYAHLNLTQSKTDL